MADDSEAQSVRQPRNAREWEAFLQKYSLGELYHTSFAPIGGEGLSPDDPDARDDPLDAQTPTGTDAAAQTGERRGSIGETSTGPSTARNSVSSAGRDERSSRRMSIQINPPSRRSQRSQRSRSSLTDVQPLPETSSEESPAPGHERVPLPQRRTGRDTGFPESAVRLDPSPAASASLAATSDSPAVTTPGTSTEVETNVTPPFSRLSSTNWDGAQSPRTTTAAGASNQDPSIPNIPSDQLAGGMPNADEDMARRREKQPAYGGDALTYDNIQQFKKEQKADERAQDDADAREDMRREEEGRTASANAGSRGDRSHQSAASRRAQADQPVRLQPKPSRRRRRPHSHGHVTENDDDDDVAARDSTDDEAEPTRRDSQATTKGPGEPGPSSQARRKKRPTRPRSRGSFISHATKITRAKEEERSTTTGTGSSAMDAASDRPLNIEAERERVTRFYNEHGYMPAPSQPPDAARRRLRAIRRLGLDNPDDIHHDTLDRFTRLAVSIFSTRMALITIVGVDRQIFLSEIGFGASWSELDISFCCHTIMSDGKSGSCFVVPDPVNDWRFAKNPLVSAGTIGFYAGAPLRIGKEGKKPAVIGTLCILDDKPRDFRPEQARLLQDLAECVVSELELLYNRTATVQSAKLHHISVEFLRRSLKHRPTDRPGPPARQSGDPTTSGTGSTHSSSKRKSGADAGASDDEVDIYDEACREIRNALGAYAVAIVDLSQFHLFYPTYQTSSIAGSSSMRNQSVRSQSMRGSTARNHMSASATPKGPLSSSPAPGSRLDSDPARVSDPSDPSSSSSVQTHAAPSQGTEMAADPGDAYSKSRDVRRARQTWALTDPTAPSRTPQVLFIPGRRRSDPHASRYNKSPDKGETDELATLGYSCAHDGFVFNFTSSPAARRIISDFIASHVQTRQVWYTRDDSEDVAQSINHLMPGGTETSLAMPVFGFDGQVAFAVVACWTDPLFSYPSGTIQFVETIAGSLLASVMKEKLHQAERAQLSFASAASHELRTPLHQINAAAALLRSNLQLDLVSPAASPRPAYTPGLSDVLTPSSMALDAGPLESRTEALAQLEIIESNGQALGNILENLIDTLNLGRPGTFRGTAMGTGDLQRTGVRGGSDVDDGEPVNLGTVVETLVRESMETEARARRVAEAAPLDDVEVIVEVLPRTRGGWLMHDDAGPLRRALSKIIDNALKFTDRGYIHVTVQDVSRDVRLPAGYDNPIKLSTISIDIKDTGRGMTSAFLEREVLRPFSKEDPFTPGSGLGLGLAQRMLDILGGKLAISSTVGQGTLVHVELPVHLLNEDNESDVEEVEKTASGNSIHARASVRQDGILLVGFASAPDVGTRRLGKCLVRNLKLHFCRVVADGQYASLVVVPDGRVGELEMARIIRASRPGVEVIVLARERAHGPLDSPVVTLAGTPARSRPVRIYRSDDGPNADTDELAAARAVLERTPTTILYRPFGPSTLVRIVQPPETVARAPETYISPVVGGVEAASEHPEAKQPTPAAAAEGAHDPAADDSPPLADAVADKQLADDEGPDREILPSPPSAARPLPEMRTSNSSSSSTSRPSRPPSARAMSTQHLPTRPPLVRDASDPFPIDAHSTVPHPQSTPPPPPASEEKAVLRVLVVEDNAVNRRILTTMLRKVACHFAEAVDGVDAVAQFRAFCPDLVLLDINMPRKDGFEAAAEMRAIERGIDKAHRLAAGAGARRGSADLTARDAHTAAAAVASSAVPAPVPAPSRRRATIIAVTAMSSEQQRRRGMVECGIDEWRTKPVSLKDLRADVERLQI
ncbi:hypothetical protein Q5752_004400 [Cryptotrichosporon argae]